MYSAREVKKQADEAEKLHKEVYGNPEDQEKTDEKDPPEQKSAEEKRPDGEEAGTPAANTEGETKPAGTTAPAGEPEQPKVVADEYEHKYKTLQGMYNAEIPRLRASIKELEEKNEYLEDLIATNDNDDTTGETTSGFVTEEDINDYGEDLIAVAKRAAREELAQEVESLRKTNQDLQKRVGDVSATTKKTERETVFTELAKAVPDWQTQNHDPNFLQWLSETDAFSGQTRQAMLNQAFESHDTPRVVAFFNGFKQDQRVTAPRTDQNTGATQPTVSMDTLVAPGPASAPQANQARDDGSNSKIYTSDEVKAFYRDVQRGAFADNPKGKQKLEAAIIKAGREGRVR